MPDWITQIDLLSHFLPQNKSQCDKVSQLGMDHNVRMDYNLGIDHNMSGSQLEKAGHNV